MARSRNIKPKFFTNDVLGELDPLARILFAGLWCHADREGRLEYRPKKLKVEILPYDECDINGLIQCLHRACMVQLYVVDGKEYLQCVNFKKHQHPHVAEPQSEIPAPAETIQAPDKTGAKTSVTFNPITDSFNPSTTLSGKPDAINGFKTDAVEILNYLNSNAGREFRPVPANLTLIAARLKSGVTPLQCREVIFSKCQQWKADPKMAEYLRPATLFNATKFEQYLGELNG